MNPRQSEDFIADVFSTTLADSEFVSESHVAVGLAPTVLIVEDDPGIATSLRIRLGIQGFQSCLATSASSAIAMALEHGPACAILDVNIPGGDGFSVAARLRRELGAPNIPLIFLTASMRPGLEERAKAFGNSAFVSKPYDAAKLMLLVDDLIDGQCRQGR